MTESMKQSRKLANAALSSTLFLVFLERQGLQPPNKFKDYA